jgi:hypothetical protein
MTSITIPAQTIPAQNLSATVTVKAETVPAQTVALPNSGASVGTYGDGTHVAQVAVNAQGIVTAASSVPIAFPAPTGGTGQDPTQFASYVQAAFAGDYVLNWTGGNVTLTAPIELSITQWKFAFGVRLNGANVTSNFNDATKAAVHISMPVVNGAVVQNVGMRNFTFCDGHFGGTTPFYGAIRMECRTNHSWIGLGLLDNLTCDGHSGYAVELLGSVFEGGVQNVTTSNGTGAFHARSCGLVDPDPNATDGDKGLPSALYIINPDFRDATGDAVLLDSATEYQEPFDLTIEGGYIVDNGGRAVNAPAGLKLVDGTGIEGNHSTEAIFVGYRGGYFRNVTGANPVAVAQYPLIRASLANGGVTIETSGIQNEGSGTGAILTAVSGQGGTVCLNNSGTAADVAIAPVWDNSGPSAVLKIAQYA